LDKALTIPDLSRLVYRAATPPRAAQGIILFIICRNKGFICLEKTTDACHMTAADERPGFGFAGCVHELHSNEFRPASSDFSNLPTTLATRDV
jgi:hypothetical protein